MGDLEAVCLNGERLPVDAASVPVLERGLHYGDALFETIACTGGQPRQLGRHLRRLARGCERLGIDPGDTGTLDDEVRTLAAQASRSVIKLLVTRGTALGRGYALTGRERPMRILLRYAWPAEDPAAQEEGVRVRLASVCLGENPALAGIKHCNRLEQILARREWTDADIADALMFSSSGALVSGTMSNVFLVRGSKILTPRIDRCGVAGVMRELVLELAQAAAIAAEERRLDAADLETADEIFLTNALIGIRPVRELGEKRRLPGPATRQLQRQLAAYLAGGPKPGGAGD
jgi:4-amino-4-deoxychorismate lyase